MLTRVNLGKYLLFFLAVLPAFILGFLIIEYGVNVPYWDQWDTPGNSFTKILQNKLSFADFFSQHNESRMVFPKAIFISLALLTHWDTRYEMLLTFVAACFISFNIYHLSRLTIGRKSIYHSLSFIVANLLIFSLVQWENWFSGFQLVILIPILCLTTCLSLALSRYGLWLKFFLCSIISVISTFSFANGIFCWLAFLPALVFSPSWKSFNAKPQLLFLWLSAFILNVGAYFYKYQKPGGSPSLLEGLRQPKQAFIYLISYLGSPLSGGNLTISAAVGTILLCLFISLSLYLFWRVQRDRPLLNRVISWFILGAYVLASGTVTTLGRVGFGIEQSLASRYTTFSIYLTIAILYLAVIVVQDFKSRTHPTINPEALAPRTLSQLLLTSLITAIVVLHLVSSVNAMSAIRSTQRDRLYAKSCLIFVNFVKSSCIKSNLYPVAGKLRRQANSFEQLGLLEPDLAKSPEIQQANASTKTDEYGWFDLFNQIARNQYMSSGWAVLPGKKQPADSVLLTYKNAEGRSILFALSSVRNQRSDVAKLPKQDALSQTGWEITVSTQGLPRGKVEINAWAFDANTGEAFKLRGSHIIQR